MKSRLFSCQRCGITFKEKRIRKFCSRKCYNSTRADRKPVVTCIKCGVSFEKQPKDIKRSPNNFCSRNCSNQYQIKEKHHHYNLDLHRSCPVCGTEIKRAGLKHCSFTCKGIANRAENSPKYNKITVACSTCGTEVKRNPSVLFKTSFCSADCKNNFHSNRLKGEANPRYKDGVHQNSKQVKLLYQGFTLKIRQKIRKLDNDTCQICGITKVEHKMNMHVHHVDYDKTNNQLHNLISLCRYCHGKVHGDEEKWLKILSEKFAV